MTSRFSFTSTTQDLVDAHEAHRTLSDPVRPLFRVILLVFGLVLAITPLWVLVVRRATLDWMSVLVGLAGWALVWRELIRPRLQRRRIRRSAPAAQEVVVEFAEQGILIQTGSGPAFTRSWDEVTTAVLCRKGLLVSFTDGIVNWLPSRVCSSRDEMASLQAFIGGRVGRRTG